MSRLLPVIDGEGLACRPSCGACCIAPSIATMVGMPLGKPANTRCIHLTPELRCNLFGDPLRPACCSGLQPSHEMCGESASDATTWISALEEATRPDAER